LPDIAKRWHIPLTLMQTCLGVENYPRVDFFHDTILLSVWLLGETMDDQAAPVVCFCTAMRFQASPGRRRD
jgi:hypothetical protein